MYYVFEETDAIYPLFGLDKISTMLAIRNKRVAEAPLKLKAATEKLADITGTHEKEVDWAVAGGIANGIGGLGAGIGAAVNAQVQNAQIRQRNMQRDRQAQDLRSAAQSLGHIATNTLSIAGAPWCVNIGTPTQELFSELTIRVKRYRDKEIELEISNNRRRDYCIDGYLIAEFYHKKNDQLFSVKIVPIPPWIEADHSSSPYATATLLYRFQKLRIEQFFDNAGCPYEVRFKPLILWKTSNHEREEYKQASKPEQFSDREQLSRFQEEWQQGTFGLQNGQKTIDDRKKKHIRTAGICIGLVIAACILVFGFILPQKAAVDRAEKYRIAQEERAEENRRFVEKTISTAQRRINSDNRYNAKEMAKDLQSASRMVETGSAQGKMITDLLIRFSVWANDRSVTKKIADSYHSGETDSDQVIQYAEQIRDFQPERGPNAMIDGVPAMFRSLSDGFPDAERYAAEYEELEKRYQAGQEMFDSKQFSEALRIFEENPYYKFSPVYIHLCKGITYWCGRWKSGSSIISIEPDKEKKVEYLSAKNPETGLDYSEPYCIYLKIMHGTTDISENKRIRTDTFADNIKYIMTTPSGLAGIYRFTEIDEQTCKIEEYDGEALNAKMIWSNSYTREK